MGYVVIDSTVGGHSSGGLRLAPDVDETEVRELARAMTLKHGFLGMPQGGAKAGVIGDSEAPREERRRRLADFARAIQPMLLSRVYIPGSDIGTDLSDIRYMLESVGIRLKRREMRGNQPGYYTALTVFTGVKESARHLGLRMSDLDVAIEGFGKVGSALATLLDEAGARITAVSTLRGAIYNPRGLRVKVLDDLLSSSGSRLVDLYPDAQRIDLDALHTLPVQVLCPCARQDSLHSGNASCIQARIISPGANNPVTSEAEKVLFGRGVLVLPDFVTNSGGVLGGRMELAQVDPVRIRSFVEQHMGARIAWLLEEASRRGVTPREVAVPVALSRFQRLQQAAARPRFRQKLFYLALHAHRRGWLPPRLVAALSLSYFEKMLKM